MNFEKNTTAPAVFFNLPNRWPCAKATSNLPPNTC